MPSPYIAGLPSMYGVVAMAKKLINSTLAPCHLIFDSVAISIGHFSMTGSQQKYPCHLYNDIRKHRNIRIITARKSYFKASIIIKVYSYSRSLEQATEWLNNNRHIDDLYNLRICGGKALHPDKQPSIECYSLDDLPELFSSLSGFMVADNIDLCRRERLVNEDALDTLIRVIHETSEKRNGWLVATAVGYKAFGPMAYRENSREQLPHTFCDPVIGLARLYRSSLIASVENFSGKIFWKRSKLDFLVEGTI